ncbi:hypothetical protein SVIOM342S_03164 [Streptomyces violaceorubidus]
MGGGSVAAASRAVALPEARPLDGRGRRVRGGVGRRRAREAREARKARGGGRGGGAWRGPGVLRRTVPGAEPSGSPAVSAAGPCSVTDDGRGVLSVSVS